MRTLRLLGLAATTLAIAQQHRAPAATRSFRDAAHGVSFRVPQRSTVDTFRLQPIGPDGLDDWRQNIDPRHNSSEPMLLETENPGPVVVFDLPSRTANMRFLYYVNALPSADACDQFAVSLSIDDVTPPEPLTVNGIPFAARHSEDGVPHEGDRIDSTLYSTYRSGFCYLFETAITWSDRSDSPADDMDDARRKEESRHTTSIPWKTVHAQLLKVMQSVRIEPPAGR